MTSVSSENQTGTVETQALISNYLEVRNHSEYLCEPLEIEDYIPQVVDFASPPKWHLAHISWFFEEMILKRFNPSYKEFHPDFGYLFNSYYNSIGERTLRAQRGNITRPGVDKIYEYRAFVDYHMKELLANNNSKELQDLVILGLNHEQQHQELLLTDFKYALGHNPIFPVYKKGFNLLNSKNEEEGWVDITAGIYEVGFEGNGFCYDNELGRHKTYLQDCQISKALVTNGEYIEFIESGAYSNFQYWLDEGWSWITKNNIKAPLHWHFINNEWHYFTLEGLQKVDPEAILGHVSYYEANAYATWKGLRLPTEFEWEIASNDFKWGERWEWTGSAYLPYPNFEIAAGAVGEYNGKFMINTMVLRGASTATSPNHSRKTYRNFFHPQMQWQFSGIRLAK